MPKVVGFGSSVRSGVKSGDAEMEPERGDYIYNSLQLMCTRSVQIIQDNIQDSFAITCFYANMMCGLWTVLAYKK